jgi:hypothetical protein
MLLTACSGVSDVPRHIYVSDVPEQNTAVTAGKRAEIAG